eukprot:1382556-Pleurochrysis_carterae.AAC.1
MHARPELCTHGMLRHDCEGATKRPTNDARGKVRAPRGCSRLNLSKSVRIFKPLASSGWA